MKKRKAKPRKPGKRSQRAKLFPFGQFANHANVRYGLSDVTLTFERTRASTLVDEWPSETVSRVTIPLAVAKVLIYNLTAYLAPMEAAYGNIPVPGAQVPQLALSPLLPAEAIARMVATHAELFPPQPERQKTPEKGDPVSLTKH